MGKRSNFERIERDFYPTPLKAIEPLIPFVQKVSFFEPCAGNGQLSDILKSHGLICLGETDIFPQNERILQKNFLELQKNDLKGAEFIITNPPWDRKILHPMIEHFVQLQKTWLLFDADWCHTIQSSEYMKKYCTDIVSVGRIKWIPDSKMTGKDNCCWYLFSSNKREETRFYGR